MASCMLGIFCVLSILAGFGHSLTCKVCMQSFSSYCSGTDVVCPAGHACASSYTLTTGDGSKLSEEFARGCVPTSRCNKTSSLSLPRGKIKMGVSCCFQDNCLPPFPTLPKDNFDPNGVTCATCSSADSDWCYTKDTMKCNGDENMCILESSHYYKPVDSLLSLRGCATKSMCDLGMQAISYGQLKMTMNITCTSAGSPLYSHLQLLFSFIVASVLSFRMMI
ncbi:phospholipase A2 inhibitor and Ly6/PLAUR domain-containing protein-like [Pyxicephalus adspersus]|uniref:UPAR/Ly6 domain-containing protein n=1 Tax=Pyxicephalus adspersus TaxID=30357 RepID=A0AAV3A0Y8_PYXAD|nr:TPA: hypothetical protein GDO54_003252 [Pyxicephalus adspersus]